MLAGVCRYLYPCIFPLTNMSPKMAHSPVTTTLACDECMDSRMRIEKRKEKTPMF